MKNVILLIALCFGLSVQTKADGFDDIANAMKNGQVSGVTKHFNTNIELTLLDNEGIYSKQQAEQMLRTFFNQHPPKSVNVKHKGSSALGAKYAIITYEATNGKFRAYVFMKDNGKGLEVNEFKLERE